jgi:hypothetical protein
MSAGASEKDRQSTASKKSLSFVYSAEVYLTNQRNQENLINHGSDKKRMAAIHRQDPAEKYRQSTANKQSLSFGYSAEV